MHYEPRYPFDGYDDDGGYAEMMDFIAGHEGPGARVIGAWLFERLRPRSIIDLGCGSGDYLVPYAERGAEVLGVDACPTGGRSLPEGAFFRWDLRFPYCPPHRFDLAYFCEVGEHLEDHWADRLIDAVYDSADVALVTWAVPGQGGHHHVNERPTQWVLDRFRERHGYTPHPLQEEWRAYVLGLPDAYPGANPPPDAPAGVPGWLKRNSLLLWRDPETAAGAPWVPPYWIHQAQPWLGGKTWEELYPVRHPLYALDGAAGAAGAAGADATESTAIDSPAVTPKPKGRSGK